MTAAIVIVSIFMMVTLMVLTGILIIVYNSSKEREDKLISDIDFLETLLDETKKELKATKKILKEGHYSKDQVIELIDDFVNKEAIRDKIKEGKEITVGDLEQFITYHVPSNLL